MVAAGFFTEAVFRELVWTTRLRELLGSQFYSVAPLRELAGMQPLVSRCRKSRLRREK